MGGLSNEHREGSQERDQSTVLREGKEILIQAFNWESHKNDWWQNLERFLIFQNLGLHQYGYHLQQIPSHLKVSYLRSGYLPQNLYSLNSAYGSEHLLKTLLQKMKQYNVRAMADIVINHRVGTTQGHGGIYNRYDGVPLPWDEHAVTSCSGGLGNQSTGDNFHGIPNIDHTQTFVRKDIIQWLSWFHNNVGFRIFVRLCKRLSPKYVKEYIEGGKANLFCWGVLGFMQLQWYPLGIQPRIKTCADSHRQRIINWIDNTGGLSTAFDFTTKGILQEAVKGELWRLCDPQGKPPGLMGWWPSRAVTFIDNHDTGSTQGHWPFPSSHIMEGYAYILTHPGIPTVFYDHFYDWGETIHDQIVKLIDIRRSHGIHSRSSVRILEARPNLYSAIIGECVCMKIGVESWCPAGGEWILATSGRNYAIWHK
ncbi:hypothetical protein IFM89_021773 [Coptis chinensis]|uniref:alpha-amylase n=1 Tax=Coptis chinensis TaxID=261450 RepID=A0A835IQ58_9MAGN|nr:hypothetical protein IFM89_021773 [Coptis chinensis]